MSSERLQLIERLYDRDRAQYPDVRHLVRLDQIVRRLKQISASLRTTPPKKLSCRRNAPLLTEYKLLKAKIAYLSVDPREDEDMFGARAVVEMTNLGAAAGPTARGGKQDAYRRRAHTVMLMQFIFRNHSIAQLSELLLG